MEQNTRRVEIPNSIVIVTVVLCLLPALLNLLGFDFGSRTTGPAPNTVQLQEDNLFRILSGAFTHTILEWSAFTVAIVTAFLTFVHFAVKKDVAIPVIGVALFFAGCMDAFHTLASDRLIEAVADNTNLIPFTWALCRLFHALIMIVGASIFILGRRQERSGELRVVLLLAAFFAFFSYAIIHLCATSPRLPRTMFPDSLITRPWDVAPLLLFLAAGFFIYPVFHKRSQTLFSHSLVVSTIPDSATQLYVAYGSTDLYDNYFNIAHFLKIVAYLIPLVGLALDHIYTHRQKEELVEDLERANRQLVRRNQELDEFSYVASHDLQEPLRKLITFSEFLKTDLGSGLPQQAKEDLGFITDAAGRMQRLVQSLLSLSRAGRSQMSHARVSLEEISQNALESLSEKIKETGATIKTDELPEVDGDPTLLTQLYQNLIENALKFREGNPRIHLTFCQENGAKILGVRDNGIGIKPEYHAQIFSPFKRLNGRAQYSGSGIGLSICRKAVERHNGSLWVESELGKGAHFKFTLNQVLDREDKKDGGVVSVQHS